MSRIEKEGPHQGEWIRTANSFSLMAPAASAIFLPSLQKFLKSFKKILLPIHNPSEASI